MEPETFSQMIEKAGYAFWNSERAMHFRVEADDADKDSNYSEVDALLWEELLARQRQGNVVEYLRNVQALEESRPGAETGLEELWERLVHGLAGCHVILGDLEAGNAEILEDVENRLQVLRAILFLSHHLGNQL